MTGLALVLLTACGTADQGGAEAETSTTTSTPTRDTTEVTPPGDTVPPSSAPITGEVPDEIMDRLISDLQTRLDDPDAAIEVVRAESVTWPNGALGCPEPGQSYTQALVDGYHVELMVGEETYDYRVGSVDNFKLCETPLRPQG